MEIAKQIGLSPSTTLRLLNTLEQNNYLFRDSKDSRYYLGFRLVQISMWAYSQVDVCRIARPHLEQLTKDFDESSGLYVVQGSRRVCVARIESERTLRRVVNIGTDLSLTRGASGHMLMAHMPEETALDLLKGDPFYTIEQLRETRCKGYCVSNGEREQGVMSVAAPVFDATQGVAAALFITGPSFRYSDELVEQMIRDIVEHAAQISAEMGYQANDD